MNIDNLIKVRELASFCMNSHSLKVTILALFISKNYFFFLFQTDLTSSGLANYKKQRPVIGHHNSKFPAVPVVPSNIITSNGRPVPQQRPKNSSEQKYSSKDSSNKKVSSKTIGSNSRPEIKEKPTFSTFKQFHRTASLR